MERSLLVGYNLCNEYTQIAVYNRETFEPKLIGTTENNTDGMLHTAATLPDDMQSLKGFISSIRKGSRIENNGEAVDEEGLLSYYFRKMLSYVKKAYPGEMIQQLVVTIEEPEKSFIDKIYIAMEAIGVGRDRVTIIDHKQSYLYFTLCQEKEIWMGDVGMFEYNEKGLFYYQMNIDRRKSPILVGITKRDFTEAMIIYSKNKDEYDAKDVIFESIVKSAIHRQIISALYMVGDGFDGDWANEVLQKLCAGRRVFVGKNLYVNGACYAARELSESNGSKDFLYLDDDMIQAHITMAVYVKAAMQEVILAKAGTPWYQAEREFDLIPDEEEELTVSVKNVLNHTTTDHMIALEGIRGRTNRMARIGVRIKFSDVKTCIITIKDKGFGDFMPSSNRIWERIIVIK